MSATDDVLNRIEKLAGEMHRHQLVYGIPANCEPKSLQPYEHKVYSQHGADGIIAEIFRRIGTTSRDFVEFGAETGVETNTVFLLMQGWSGAWIEGAKNNFDKIREIFKPWVDRERLNVGCGVITAENIESCLAAFETPAEFDLLSVDIDYNTYWVWKAIQKYKPRVVVVEYNASFGPSAEWKANYIPDRRWDNSRNFGASLKSYELLGHEKGYRLVGCDLSGVDAFFVREDLAVGKFLEPFTSERHYQPPRYWLKLPEGHAPSLEEFANRI